MRRLLLVFLFSSSMALLSQPAAAQLGQDLGSPGSSNPKRGYMLIVGSVTAAGSNAPLDHVQIYLRQYSGQVIAKTITSSTGSFMIREVPRDNYIVAAQRDGFLAVEEDLDITYSMGTAMVTMVMLPVPAGATPPTGTISAQRLAIPERAMEEYKKGLAELHDKKDPEASLPHFQLAVKEAPEFPEAYFHSGLAYRILGSNEQAETAFRKTIELSPVRFLGARFRLASVLVDLKKYSEAVTVARQGLVDRPKSWFGNFELGRALVGLGRQEEAESSVRKAVELNPHLTKGYLLLATFTWRAKSRPRSSRTWTTT